MNQHFRISKQLLNRLEEQKISLATLAHVAGLPAGFFQQERIHATTEELFAIFRGIDELSEDPIIGLKLGSEQRMERFHPPAVVVVCSRTFRDALHRMARYKQLTCPEEIRVETKGDEVVVEFLYTEASEQQPTILVDLGLSWIRAIGSHGTDGQIRPVRVELSRPAKHRELYENHFGCRVKFKAVQDAIIFQKKDLDRPFITYNQELVEVIGAKLEDELEALRTGMNVGDLVKQSLCRSLAGRRPTLQDTARELGMSTRTLQRKLGETQVTFQQVLEGTRREMAKRYLSRSRMELNEVAFLLGYEDANSFFRAFQIWEGTSPGEWRKRGVISML